MTEEVEENNTTTSSPSVSDSTETPANNQDDPERKKLKVNFSHVDIYYFEGNTLVCVPQILGVFYIPFESS